MSSNRGDVFNFQAWCRDVGAANDFTDAVAVTLQQDRTAGSERLRGHQPDSAETPSSGEV